MKIKGHVKSLEAHMEMSQKIFKFLDCREKSFENLFLSATVYITLSLEDIEFVDNKHQHGAITNE